MKQFFAIAGLLLPTLAGAHIGSPNVFLDGQAGPYPVRVVVRPPAVLPGTAQVDVRVEGATNLTLQASLWEAGSATAPAPVAALAVAGQTNLFHGAVWLFFAGTYSLKVRVEGSLGAGTALLPLGATALSPPAMSSWLAALLLALGVLLGTGAIWMIAVAARESVLAPGVDPSGRERVRARRVAVATSLLLAGVVAVGTQRWRKMDREFRTNALYRPTPVLARLRSESNLLVLRLEPEQESPNAPGWDTLVADHGKLMHLFLLREPGFDVFAHLHPTRRDGRTFELVLPPLPAGGYRLYGEITQENGLSQTLTASLVLPNPLGRAPQTLLSSNLLNEVFCQSSPATGNGATPLALDPDDSWHVGTPAVPSPPLEIGVLQSRLMGGMKMVLENADRLVENQETSLRFGLFGPEGQPAPIQPYMGMNGHLVARRTDGTVFTHLHPVGTFSMAAQQILFQREGAGNLGTLQDGTRSALLSSTRSNPGHEVTFPYAFPRAGDYRLWVQVRWQGRVLTGVFDLQVMPVL